MDDLLTDFVAETREMLEASAGEIVAWEADPADNTRLDGIFRFVHTVKGNCGFFDFPRLEKLSHAAEDALSEVRAGRRTPDAALVTATLAVMDRIGAMIDAIEAGEDFPEGGDDAIIEALSENSHVELSAMLEDARQSLAPGLNKTASPAAAPRSIRLPVELLDRVMSGVSDMVLARNDLAHRLSEAGTQPTIDGPFERLTSILTDVRDAITRMRMQRVEHLFGALPRLVRDLSAELGKQVMIDLEGGNVELDREMIEMIRDPLTHIIRNAIDHGIELPAERLKLGKREIGLLNIAARQSGNKISIVVTDDGGGLDANKIAAKAVENGIVTQAECDALSQNEVLQLVFEPGLSTADEISSISGRGVGLDVVRDNLEKIGGSIRVTSTQGVGSLFYLQIPLTLSIIAGLTVEVGGQCFAIPQSYIEEIVDLRSGSLEFVQIGETSLVTFRGERTPCLSLAQVLNLKPELQPSQQTLVILRLANGDLFALGVDRIHSHGDLVVKPLPPAIMATQQYGGSTLLENGRPVLLLDMPQIALNSGLVSDTRSQKVHPIDRKLVDDPAAKQHAMLFEGFDGVSRAIRLELVHRIETIYADAIEPGAERAKAVIDNEILPLIGLPQASLPKGKIRVLRLSDGGCELLYAVGKIKDSAVIDQPLVPVDDDPFVEATTLVNGQMVSLVDGHAIFAKYGSVPQPTRAITCRVPDSEWAATILAPLVVSAGYQLAGPDVDSADVVILLDTDAAEYSAASHASARSVIQLRSQPDQETPEQERTRSIYRYDRDGLIAALRHANKGVAA
jgi:two-component system chemotaxis sensor kinase CheA